MRELIRLTSHISDEVIKRIRFGKSKEQIIKELSDLTDNINILTEVVESVIDEYPSYSFIQRFMRSQFIADQESDDLLIADPVSRRVEPVVEKRLKDVLAKEFDYKSKITVCRFTYNPFKMSQVYSDEHDTKFFNQYVPPAWQADYFYSQGKVQVEKSELPELYKEYLMHLVDNDEPSYNYILDWCANTVQDRNYCMLVTIGEEGIGKGLLGDVMEQVLGPSNYNRVKTDFLSKSFNSELKNKRMVYLDEISLKNDADEEKLKSFINDQISVEQKHKDAKTVTNYASFYLSSNSLGAIKINEGDRRYSIVNLTETKLTKKWSKQKISTLLNKENTELFAKYLYYRKYDKDKMMQVFRSAHRDVIKAASLHPWQDWLLDDYAVDNAGKEISVKTVGEAVVSEFTRVKPGRTALQELAKRYPDKLKVWKKQEENKQIWTVLFIKQEKK